MVFLSKEQGGSKTRPHRGLPVLGTRRGLRETRTRQGRPILGLPLEGYINEEKRYNGTIVQHFLNTPYNQWLIEN